MLGGPLLPIATLGPGEIPQHFLCCITQDIMVDPVVAADGMTYEKAHIQHWLQTHDTSPQTGQVLEHKMLIPNLALKKESSFQPITKPA